MINNRPKYLEENINYYSNFPTGYHLEVDYSKLPPMLNFDFHTLNGIQPLTTSRFEYIGVNGSDGENEGTIVFVNPLPEEYEYYESIGVKEFQAIQIVFNFFAFEESENRVLKGLPYSVSLVPMEKNKKIDTWHIDLLKQFDLERLCQEGGEVFTDFNPFKGWYDGLAMQYSLFSSLGHDGFSDSIGFLWGMYFLSPIFDKKEVRIPEMKSYSRLINANYRKFKTDLYFKRFDNVTPRRIWGCDSPIELFLLQGLHIRNIHPEVQMCFYKNGVIFPNYFKMQEQEYWLSQDKLITSSDFYIPEKKIAIFCDGKEFHNEEKDKKITESLKTLGIKVLRFQGSEINNEIEKVLDKIENEINK